MSPLHPVAPRKSQDSINIVPSSALSYYPITETDIQVIIVLWVLFVITLIFVCLRLYSRVKILQFYALEDYLYNIAFTLLLAYNAIITYYSYHGLGSQLLDTMTTADVKLAVVFENVLFDLASLGLLIAKASLIAFLMRLVPQHHRPLKWRTLIIGPLFLLVVVSLGSMLAYWARCFAELAGDSLLCLSIDSAMLWMQVAAGVSVGVDLWYAAMPWYLLRRLTRPRKEKWLVQGSMSLGVIAAACGIGRAVSIYPAMTNADAKSAAILYLWHGAEMAVTMICIGMPVCRPAVSSMLEAIGVTIHLSSDRTGANSSSNKRHHKKSGGGIGGAYPATSSYIRNFGQNATWEEAVSRRGEDNDAAVADTWSQRRILGMGHATSHCETTTGFGSGGGGGGGGGDSSASDLEYKEGAFLNFREDGAREDLSRGEDGYPMRKLSRSGITVTKTVAVTKESG
ncbi:unnamed protein product [Discula destructiva]